MFITLGYFRGGGFDDKGTPSFEEKIEGSKREISQISSSL
jgi:hypothetical protein